MNNRNKLVVGATAITLIAAAPLLIAQEKKTEPAKPTQQSQPYRPGGGMGPGMMGDDAGRGMMGGRGGYGPGFGPGYGMGPGMMGGDGQGYGPGYGMGPDMMGGRGGYGMGPGMMGGYGMGMMGPGMMGGYGMGPGMMGGSGMGMMGQAMMMGPGGMGRMGAIWSLDLTEEQAGRIDKIRDDLMRKHRGVMSQMWEAQDRLRDQYGADNRDAAAIGKAYTQVSDLQRQMLEAQVQSEERMEEVLTKEQREQLWREFRRNERFNRYGR